MSTKIIAVERAMALLNAADAVFEIHYEGRVFGGLPKQEPETQKLKRVRKIPSEHRGKMTNHIRNTIQAMKGVGDVAMFYLSDPDLSHVNIEQLQASVASIASATWGLKSYISHRIDNNTAVELLRVA